MRVTIDELGNSAHIWIFGISPSLDPRGSSVLLDRVDAFLDEWAAHGVPIRGARELCEGSFLIIAADDQREKSGCSIDRMFGTLRDVERELSVSILDSNRVFFREGGIIRAVPRAGFRDVADEETPVFDTTAERLEDIRTGSWQRRAADSWHQRLL